MPISYRFDSMSRYFLLRIVRSKAVVVPSCIRTVLYVLRNEVNEIQKIVLEVRAIKRITEERR